MPMHDWTRVDSGLFHHFHQDWTVLLCNALNTGALPPDCFALIEGQLQRHTVKTYTGKANRVTVRHRHGEVVAVIEVVSPGNKATRAELRAFVEKAADLMRQQVHLLIIDLFPPGPRDPHGIHQAIWEQFEDTDETPPPADKPLTLAAYESGEERIAYVEWLAVGEAMPSMPIFLKPGYYVPAPLEATYQATWQAFPAPLKRLFDAV